MSMSQGTILGSDAGGAGCDGAAEGVGFCWDEYSLVFCAQGNWWLLDCTYFGAFCAYDVNASVVDCYTFDEWGSVGCVDADFDGYCD